MKTLACCCAILAFGLLSCQTARSNYEGQAQGAAPTKVKPKPVDRRIRVKVAGNARGRAKGSFANYKPLHMGDVLSTGTEILTTTLQATIAMGPVTLTIYPNSHVVVYQESVDLNPSPGAYTNSQVRIDEDLTRFLSGFRVLSRINDLTLGGFGTAYTVHEHFKDGELDGLDIQENDTSGPHRVYVFFPASSSGSRPRSILGVGEHKWVDVLGNLNP